MAPSATIFTPLAPLVRRTAPSALRPCVVLGPSKVQFPRSYGAMPSKRTITREMERAARQLAKKTGGDETLSSMQRRSNDAYFKSSGGPLFPGTFVSLPITQYPRGSVSDFSNYTWYRIKQWAFETLSLLDFKIKSMPNWTTRPKFKVGRGRIAPTAKAMYTEMLTAFAAGDRETIRTICLGNFGNKLLAAIDRRDPSVKMSFEVVSFTKPLFYPRVAAHQINQINPDDKEHLTEQAVVAISSKQRVTKHRAATGELIPGSAKIQDKVEHVVLSRTVSVRTFQPTGPWKIWGTVPVTTLEGYRSEQAWIRKEQAKQAGWKE